MPLLDVTDRQDIEEIITRFYETMLKDPIIGYIFTDVAEIDLEEHIPIIVDFWTDIIFKENNYTGNPMRKHVEINDKLTLTPGHFTRWLYLFDRAVDQHHQGPNADTMKRRAEMVAKSISAHITAQKRQGMHLKL